MMVYAGNPGQSVGSTQNSHMAANNFEGKKMAFFEFVPCSSTHPVMMPTMTMNMNDEVRGVSVSPAVVNKDHIVYTDTPPPMNAEEVASGCTAASMNGGGTTSLSAPSQTELLGRSGSWDYEDSVYDESVCSDREQDFEA